MSKIQLTFDIKDDAYYGAQEYFKDEEFKNNVMRSLSQVLENEIKEKELAIRLERLRIKRTQNIDTCEKYYKCPSFPEKCDECREKSRWFREFSKEEQQATIQENVKALKESINAMSGKVI